MAYLIVAELLRWKKRNRHTYLDDSLYMYRRFLFFLLLTFFLIALCHRYFFLEVTIPGKMIHKIFRNRPDQRSPTRPATRVTWIHTSSTKYRNSVIVYECRTPDVTLGGVASDRWKLFYEIFRRLRATSRKSDGWQLVTGSPRAIRIRKIGAVIVRLFFNCDCIVYRLD